MAEFLVDDFRKIGCWKGSVPDKPEIDLMTGIVNETTGEHTKYYVSDTEMIERRFLKNATETFEKERDTDPFSDCVLRNTEIEAAYDALNVLKEVKKIHTDYFMKNGRNADPLEIIKELSSKKSYSVTEDLIETISVATGTPLVREDTEDIRDTPWDSRCDKVGWIKKVPDGYLGLAIDVKDGLLNDVLTKPNVSKRNFIVRKKIVDIKNELTRLGIEHKGLKKKQELVDLYCRNVLFAERFLCKN